MVHDDPTKFLTLLKQTIAGHNEGDSDLAVKDAQKNLERAVLALHNAVKESPI